MDNYRDGVKLINRARLDIVKMPAKLKEELGKMALEMLADYPLYGSSSNISYEDAIATAIVLFGEIKTAYKEYKENY